MSELRLDLDDERNAFTVGAEFEARRRFLKNELGLSLHEIDVKETRRGFHVRIQSRGLAESEVFNSIETVIVQLLLGSDWRREAFNFSRIRSGADLKEWNLLFQQKYKLTEGGLELLSEERVGLRSFMFCAGMISRRATGILKRLYAEINSVVFGGRHG